MTTPRLTPERLAEIREKVREWERLAEERPHQVAHTKTTLAVMYLLAELDAVRGELEQWKEKARAIAQDRAEIWEQVGTLEKHAADTEQQIEALTGELAELRSVTPAQVERAAREIWEGINPGAVWPPIFTTDQLRYEAIARRALTAALSPAPPPADPTGGGAVTEGHEVTG